MATKTISIDLEAYQQLVAARRHPRESFSQVIHRAVWPDSGRTCAAFLTALEQIEPLSEAGVRDLERGQLEDRPPEDRWGNG